MERTREKNNKIINLKQQEIYIQLKWHSTFQLSHKNTRFHIRIELHKNKKQRQSKVLFFEKVYFLPRFQMFIGCCFHCLLIKDSSEFGFCSSSSSHSSSFRLNALRLTIIDYNIFRNLLIFYKYYGITPNSHAVALLGDQGMKTTTNLDGKRFSN